MILSFVAPLALSPHATRVDALLKEISALAGGTYKASEPMAGRIVLVAGPARPVEAIRTNLAEATYGRWRRVADDWILEVDKSAETKRDAARLASRVAMIKTWQDSLRREPYAPLTEASAKALQKRLDEADKKEPEGYGRVRSEAETTSFGNAAVRRVVASLDPNVLARVDEGARTVWSDLPNRLQRPLGAEGGRAVRAVERDQAVWSAVARDDPEFGKPGSIHGWGDPRFFRDPVAPGSLRLVLVGNQEYGALRFTGSFVDATGRLHQRGAISCRSTPSPPESLPPVDPAEPNLPRSEEASALTAACHGAPPSPRLQGLLKQPEKIDPLDLIAGDALRGVAKARQTRIIAWLGDDLIRTAPEAPRTAGAWLRDLAERGYELRPSSGATVVRPRFAAVNVDRRDLSALIRTSEAKGYVPLDDLAEYAARNPSNDVRGDWFSRVVLAYAIPGRVDEGYATWDALSIWGGFSRAQRATLLKRGAIPWDAVPTGQRDRLIDAVLRTDERGLRVQGPRRPFSLDLEPTELLAKGFGYGNGVVGTGGQTEGALAAPSEDNPQGTTLLPAGLAEAVFDREAHPESERYRDGLPKILPERLWPGKVIDFGLEIELAPGVGWNKRGRYGEFDRRSAPRPISELPLSFRREYERILTAARKVGG